MALFENGFKMSTGMLVGIGALLLAPVVLPMAAVVVRPVAKAVIKSGIVLYRKSKEALAETAEMIEDLAAEAEAEILHDLQQSETIPPAPGETAHAS